MEGVTVSGAGSQDPWFFGPDKSCYIDVWGEKMCSRNEPLIPRQPEQKIESCMKRAREESSWVRSYIGKLKKWDVEPERIEGALAMGLRCEGSFPKKVYRWLMQ